MFDQTNRISYSSLSSYSYSSEKAAAGSQFVKEQDYWRQKLAGPLVKTDFPYDHIQIQAIPGTVPMDTVSFDITGKLLESVLKLSNGDDTKIHMILTAVLLVLLYKHTVNSDIIIGTPIYRQETEGEFLNTVLALRNQLEEQMTFKEILLQVRKTIGEADKNQNYPIEGILENLDIQSDGKGFPLFGIVLLLENLQDKKYIRPLIPHLNMVFSFHREKHSLEGVVEYNVSLYQESTIKRIANHYKQVLQCVLSYVDLPVSRADILTKEERQKVLIDFNDTAVENRYSGTLHQLFEQQVERTPDHVALVGIHQTHEKNYNMSHMSHMSYTIHISYKELNEISNQFARLLRKNGVTTESVVGIMMEPSPGMAIGLMAILKAGGAYLPIDPGLPAERVGFMLEDSHAAALLTTNQTIADIPFTELQGFGSRQDIRVKVTPPRAHIQAFDQLPQPDRSLIDLRNYNNKIGMASVTNCISVQSTRGCPYHCLYCHKIWSKHHVHRSAENLYNEIEYYYKNGVSNFAFIDDCFNLNSESSKQLFHYIIKNKLKMQIFFPNGLRGDIMTADYIDLMVEAGTRGINLSLETASPRLQKLLKKNLDLDKFKRVIDYIAHQHPDVILEMASMHGFPGESQEEALMTLDFIKRIQWLDFPYIHILKIFPNTQMEVFALEQGISKEDIMKSKDRAFHELPETLPFPKSFTRKFQADFLNNYFLNKERLMHVLPFQMKVFSKTALVQKYNAYLPVEIKSIHDVIGFAQLENVPVPESYRAKENTDATIFDWKPRRRGPQPGAKKILFLDLSQHFSTQRMLYRVVEQPLGLISLLTYLKQRFPDKIDGRIYKSGNDFDSFEELKALVDEYNPHLVGIRTLTFFQEFFHETVSLLRQWGVKAPIITGGPYASSDYHTILKDKHVDLAVLGEGEHTLEQLIREMLKNEFRLPVSEVLNKIQGIAYAKDIATNSQSREIILADHLESTIKEEEHRNLPLYSHQHHLAYVMYTSGSTGTPKGVMVEHRQVNNCISWMQDKFNLEPRDVIANRTDLTFDPSVWEIFWPLYLGGSVKVLDRHQRKDAEFLIRTMAEEPSLTMMYCPATLINIMTYLLNTKAVKPCLKLPWLIIGAEPISMDTVKDFYRYYQGKIVNTYGPTEGTINNTYYDIPRDDNRAVVPIGKPIANNRIYILDRNLQPVPFRIPGEICIVGDSLARGYLNKPQLTAEKFCLRRPGGTLFRKNCPPWNPPQKLLINRGSSKNCHSLPHSPYSPYLPYSPIYKTGDMGRWLEDGTIEIMGRVDDQIKIRGYRIEPGEIEKALLTHPLIRECLVLVRDSQTAAQQVKRCGLCGITTQYPQVTINSQGVCNICELYRQYKPNIHGYFRNPQQLEQTIKEINQHRQGRYDCLLLYAGGKGAAYALYRLVEMGFKVLAATYDHGYFGKAHLKNIRKITTSLGVDHVVLTHRHSDQILAESIKIAATVCRGCFHTSSSLAAEYAYKHHIPVVVGATLSRGQIIENKLLMFLQQGITDARELEKEVANLQRSAPAIDRSIFDYIDIAVVKNGVVHDAVKFLDFYRYCNISNGEMIAYLDKKDPYWKTRKNDAIYSTNCPIKQMGDFAHLEEKGYHYYGGATSWEKRLEHLTRQNLEKDLTCKVTPKAYRNFLKRIGRRQEWQDKPVKPPGKYICAYYVPDPTGIPPGRPRGDDVWVSDLRDYLVKKVPAYMIPSYFVQLERIPLTSNGKIDKNALPAPELKRSKAKATYIAPKTDIEKVIAEIWKEVLKVDMAGVHDNFFDLGGNSLDIIMVGSKLKEVIEREIPVVTLFTYPTVHSLACHIDQAQQEIAKDITVHEQPDRKHKIEEGKNRLRQSIRRRRSE
ncbi:MAG: AMP-binding protein [Candidatus Aminicenantes bacterium]|jgi:amino acid adenylation domain-containing protein